LIDTATCGLIGLLAFYWQPDEQKKRASAIAALALAAICPFTTIYAATILTEVPTNFLVVAMMLAATLALRKQFTTEETEEGKRKRTRQTLQWWIVAGVIGGLAVLFRPDNGLFVAAVGLTLVIGGAMRFWSAPGRAKRRRLFGVLLTCQRFQKRRQAAALQGGASLTLSNKCCFAAHCFPLLLP
jgi:4-amino-4-deoxy-L-arabinose transferase-like glycosyltransferase